MSRVLRLYPAAWRERYEDELRAVLEDSPPGAGDLFDLCRGAFDAHLHGVGSRRTAAAVPDRRTATMIVVAGAAWLLAMAQVTAPGGGLAVPLLSLAVVLFPMTLRSLEAVRPGGAPWLVARAGIGLAVGGLVALGALGDGLAYLAWFAGIVVTLAATVAIGVRMLVTRGSAVRSVLELGLGTLLQAGAIFATDHVRDAWALAAGAVFFGGSWMLIGARSALPNQGTVRP